MIRTRSRSSAFSLSRRLIGWRCGRSGKISLDSFRRGGRPRSGGPSQMPAQRPALARRGRHGRARLEKSWRAARSPVPEAPRGRENPGVESPQKKGALMELCIPAAELDQLGDEIAEL